VYLTIQVPEKALAQWVAGLPASVLVVDYERQLEADNFGLRPKAELEAVVRTNWKTVETFMATHQVQSRQWERGVNDPDALDDAVDALLGVESEVLPIASAFQHAIDLARPLLAIPKQERDRYEAFLMLAHRVQTLAPGGFSAHFLNTYADDVFFFSDLVSSQESLAEAVARHEQAGRFNVARALLQFGSVRTLNRRLVAVV